ncbi:MAG: hypothetical protein AB1898_11460 [Acidobacteriota bacterium]
MKLHSISEYLHEFSTELDMRIVTSYPPLHLTTDPLSPRLENLLRRPFPGQALCVMGIVKRWQQARAAAVFAEMGTGKTLIALAALHVHAERKPFNALAIVPPQLVEKWCREAILTIPKVRVFVIDGLRSVGDTAAPNGVNEVKLRRGRVVREGLHTSLVDLRLRQSFPSALARWKATCPGPALFVVGRDRSKLGYFWRPAFQVPVSGQYSGMPVNPDTGTPVSCGEGFLLEPDFQKKLRHSERIAAHNLDGKEKARRILYSPLWQADGSRIRRFAPIDFIGRYLGDGFFSHGIFDEVHEGYTTSAQGNALGTLAASVGNILVLTGTANDGYADSLFNALYRLDPTRMKAHGLEWGASGLRTFTELYGVIEKVTVTEPEENSCSKSRTTTTVRRRPGASPLLFGHFLMNLGCFLSLEDVAESLPPFEETIVGVSMDSELENAYLRLEADVKRTLRENRGNRSVMSTMLNALLLYPDHPYQLGELWGFDINPVTRVREEFLIARTRDLDPEILQAKERRLVELVKEELQEGRRCQIFAVYTGKHDVTARLASILAREGIRAAVLTARTPPEKREAWYELQLRQGVEVFVAHPKLVATGMDLLFVPSLFFYETGYSTYTLRQASRRSWRIGQRAGVKVYYLHYERTLQSKCIALMGKKLLAALALEGKFGSEGLQGLDEDGDLLVSLARELVSEKGVGESAEQVWRNIAQQQTNLLSQTRAVIPKPSPQDLRASEAAESNALPLFSPSNPVQLSLFDLLLDSR